MTSRDHPTAGRAGAPVEISCEGGDLPGYLAVPAAGRGRGVLVVQEAWGLVDHVKNVCDRLARAGFVALAPDLYRGAVASDREHAHRLMDGLDVEAAARDLDAGVLCLLGRDATDGSRVGAVGFCMGGPLALLLATRNARVGAVADFYGVHAGVEIDFAKLEAPVLGIFGQRDEYVPAEAVRRFEDELREAGVRATIRVQPGAGHAFMNETRADCHDPVAAARSWDALLAFLGAEL